MPVGLAEAEIAGVAVYNGLQTAVVHDGLVFSESWLKFGIVVGVFSIGIEIVIEKPSLTVVHGSKSVA